jgi:hypothetical protein
MDYLRLNRLGRDIGMIVLNRWEDCRACARILALSLLAGLLAVHGRSAEGPDSRSPRVSSNLLETYSRSAATAAVLAAVQISTGKRARVYEPSRLVI